jgi:hypothetical protein
MRTVLQQKQLLCVPQKCGNKMNCRRHTTTDSTLFLSTLPHSARRSHWERVSEREIKCIRQCVVHISFRQHVRQKFSLKTHKFVEEFEDCDATWHLAATQNALCEEGERWEICINYRTESHIPRKQLSVGSYLLASIIIFYSFSLPLARCGIHTW